MNNKFKGNLALLGAVGIWSGWMIQTRYLALGPIGPFDLAALRFSFAALFLFPIMLRRGFVFEGGTFAKGLVLAACLGVPYMLIVASGMQFAPASHGAAIINGMMVLTSVLLAYFLSREKPTGQKIMGLVVIAGGLGVLISHRVAYFNRGHFLFLTGGLLWGVYSVLLKKWKVNPLHATAIVGSYSALFYIPVYFIFFKGAYSVSRSDLIFHAIYQGGLASGLALFLFSYGVATLGAGQASFYMPLVPVLTTLLAVAVLHETPGAFEVAAITLIVIGFGLTLPGLKWGGRTRSLISGNPKQSFVESR